MAKASASNISSGGGMFTGPALIKEAEFDSRCNFGGQIKQRVTALVLTLEYMSGTKTAERKVYLTVNKFGKTTWKASEDGEEAANSGPCLYAEKAEDISDGTAFGAFQKSLFDAGFEYSTGDINVSELVGLKVSFDVKDAATKESPDRKLNIVESLLESLPWEKGGKGAKVKFEKNGKLPKGAAAEADDEDEDEDAADDEDEEGDDAETDEDDEDADDDEAEAEDEGIDKATVANVMTAVMAANKKGVKLKALQTPLFAVIATKFKSLATKRKDVLQACVEYIESGAKNKIFTYDEDTTLISPKK